MAKRNLILFGDVLIDMHDVKCARLPEDETLAGSGETRVYFKHGGMETLTGDAKAAFDAWAATLPRAGGDGIDMEQIIDRIIARDRDDLFPTEKEWREWLRECLRGKTDPKPLCATCACYEAESGHCTEFAGNHYPECWVAKEGESLLEHSHWHRHGDKKHVHDHAMIDHHDDGEPTTAKPRAASKGPWPPESGIWSKCGTCSDYYSGTRHCEKGYPVSDYPECYVVREKEAAMREHQLTKAAHEHWHDHDATDKFGQPGRIHHSHEHPDTKATGAGPDEAAEKVELPPRDTLCQSCQFYNPDTRRCTKGEREEFPECHVDNVWACSGCGLALGTDMKGQIVRVSSGGCELYIQGEVRIQSNDVPLVVCTKCRTANLWPEELRERIGGEAPEPKPVTKHESAEYPHAVRSWVPKHNHIHPHDTISDRGEPWHTKHNHEHPVGHHGQDEEGNYV